MSRTNQSARQAGSKFETLISTYLAEQLADDRIERRVKNGAKDRGDIAGVRTITGGRVVLECKSPGKGQRYQVSPWLDEAERERGNDDAVAGLVVAKRHGRAAAGAQVVFMTVDDFITILTGARPDLLGVELAPEVAEASGADALADLIVRGSE